MLEAGMRCAWCLKGVMGGGGDADVVFERGWDVDGVFERGVGCGWSV